jgi:NAD+ kinase
MREITVLTHRRPDDVQDALRLLAKRAAAAGVRLRLTPEETVKHGALELPDTDFDAEISPDVELCVVLGGDGTILRALQHYAGTSVAVFAINFGEIGFLATVEPGDVEDGIRRALEGDFELLHLPAVTVDLPDGPRIAINDVAIHRKEGERIAELAYSLDGEEAGSVRCDGLVVATPAGSTGYNLANGGPVMAWGVHGYVVSFIAPHSLTARTLVVAPDDHLTVHNRSQEEAVDVTVDGRPICVIDAGDRVEARFLNDLGRLAQIPGTSFYQRLRQKFGRLATPL